MVAGQKLGIRLVEIGCNNVIWGSDHCVVVMTAILSGGNSCRHYLLPHGPAIGENNAVRDRSIFYCVYVYSEFQRLVYLGWQPELNVEVINGVCLKKNIGKIENNIKRDVVLFVNQYDLGFKAKYEISNELCNYINSIPVDAKVSVVVKDLRQREKISRYLNIASYYLGVDDFFESGDFDNSECVVFTSGVALDLMMSGFDVTLSVVNPLVTDEVSRELLKIPPPKLWRERGFYQFKLKSLSEGFFHA
jgi:hypothetical protein